MKANRIVFTFKENDGPKRGFLNLTVALGNANYRAAHPDRGGGLPERGPPHLCLLLNRLHVLEQFRAHGRTGGPGSPRSPAAPPCEAPASPAPTGAGSRHGRRPAAAGQPRGSLPAVHVPWARTSVRRPAPVIRVPHRAAPLPYDIPEFWNSHLTGLRNSISVRKSPIHSKVCYPE